MQAGRLPKAEASHAFQKGSIAANRANACSALRSKVSSVSGAARPACAAARSALLGVDREAVGDQRVARGEIVEAAESILHILERGERLLSPPGARLARKRAGKEFGRVAQPLGANAQFVPLLDAQVANVGALALDALAKL